MSDTPEAQEQVKIDRIHTFDLLRGGAIIGILVFHRVLWDYFFSSYTGGAIPPEIGVMYLFITMAGIFYVISGAVNAYMIQKRLTLKRISARVLVAGGWITGILMLLYSLAFRVLLLRFIDDSMPLVQMDDSLINLTGILPYYLMFGRLPDPAINPASFIGMETLGMIGVTIIFVSTLMGAISKWKGLEYPRIVYGTLASLGLFFLAVSPFLRFAIGEFSNNAFHSGNYLVAFFLEPLVNGMMPIFPHLSYGCFGAMVGVAIARNENPRKVLGYTVIFAAIALVIGAIYMGNIDALPGQEPFTWAANINLLARKLLQLGFFFILIFLGLALLDYRSASTRERWSRLAQMVPDFGKLALTVYMLEGLVAVVLQLIVAPIWPQWNATLVNIILFGLLNILVWSIILVLWEKAEYKGSMEWCLVWVVQKLSGKKSSRFRD
ncbi:MAG: hypothetical protein JSW61_02955 [Candidatus Thorarchaeota archaeon]|nr:MAG: hypothetical protein JSW61_02955 [Candidatus Thorarchaeota archaeon]